VREEDKKYMSKNYSKPSVEIPGFAVTNYDGTKGPDENQCRVQIGDLELFFSYKTLIAYRIRGSKMRVCENMWSRTTGQHLGKLDKGESKNRIPFAEFQREVVAIDAYVSKSKGDESLAEFISRFKQEAGKLEAEIQVENSPDAISAREFKRSL
jgi:hypothetical protein